MVAVLKNGCLMYWRARRRKLYRAVEEGFLEGFAAPQPPPSTRIDLRCDFGKLLHQIPARCQKLIRLRYALGLNPREVGKKLGYCQSSISNITRRCLAALILFRQAAEAEQVTLALVREIAAYLEKARSNPKLKFERGP